MISIVTYGRNDNYGYNLHKRTAMGFNCLGEMLTPGEDEILFTDYNTPDHLPTLPEFIWDTLTERALDLIRVVRISKQIHEEIKSDSELQILENVSRNAALVRSNPENRWVLSTNPDVLIVLASRWKGLGEALSDRQDSFFESPRFDIPESVWSALDRHDPKKNIEILRDWLVTNGAAVAETVPDHRFQRFLLFDAPGDFQLAPRSFYFKLRGFDESMRHYLHSDSNLAKRMWLLNGRTDQLLDELWVLHQDHYLSGEWARNVHKIRHNDYTGKVLKQWRSEANDENWGLQQRDLPTFRLRDRVTRRRISFGSMPALSDGDLRLTREPDWSFEPLYRICHYDPQVLTLYLRETLNLLPGGSQLAYMGDCAQTQERVKEHWEQCGQTASIWSCDSPPATEDDEEGTADVLLVDCYYQRSPEIQQRVDKISTEMRSQVERGRLKQEEAAEAVSQYADALDGEILSKQREAFWQEWMPKFRVRPGSYLVLLGCNTQLGLYLTFQELFATLHAGLGTDATPLQKLHAWLRRRQLQLERHVHGSVVLKAAVGLRLWKRSMFNKAIGHGSIMGWIYYHHVRSRGRALANQLALRTLYVHHRLVIMRVEGETL